MGVHFGFLLHLKLPTVIYFKDFKYHFKYILKYINHLKHVIVFKIHNTYK